MIRRIALSPPLVAALVALTGCGDDATTGHIDSRAVDSDDAAVDSDDAAVDSDDDAAVDSDDAGGKPDSTGGGGVQTDPAAVTTETLPDGVRRTRVDAEDGALWVHFGFDDGALHVPADGWDLALQRYLVKLGDGASAAALDDQDFAALTVAPADGYAVDAGGDSSEDFAMGLWYDYDPMHHTLAPKAGRVYVVRTTRGDHYKVAIRDYYDDAGSSGLVTFDWAPIAAPGGGR